MDGALILARYSLGEEPRFREINQIVALIQQLPKGPPPGAEGQRTLLMGLLSSPRPGFGLELLKAAGFIAELWPELALLDDVDHSKEFHPEGNVWKHTMETFRYRKTAINSKTSFDFRLSLGLLLHDVGKPISESSGNHRFEAHAELGARQARKFLERLGFEKSLIEDTSLDRDGGVLDFCRLNDITIQTWSPFRYNVRENDKVLKGVFLDSDKYPELNMAINKIAEKYGVSNTTIALAWILRHPAQMQAVTGTTNARRLKDCIKATEISLTYPEWYEIYLAAGNTLP
jgi:putative nucleotidyltransferase with HDIG domain